MLTRLIISPIGNRGDPSLPVPRIASTTTSERDKHISSSLIESSYLSLSKKNILRSSSASCSRMERFTEASPFQEKFFPIATTSTRYDNLCKCRAITKPSPPLLPGPAIISMREEGMTFGIAARSVSVRTRPAFSMRITPGIFNFSMAYLSKSRIWAQVNVDDFGLNDSITSTLGNMGNPNAFQEIWRVVSPVR